MISRDALRVRIERRFAVNEKLVVMMAMRERHLDAPAATVLALHRVRARVPIIEIAHQKNLRGVWSRANEIHRLGHFLGGVTVQGRMRMSMRMRMRVAVRM